jgi:hypothetical protein
MGLIGASGMRESHRMSDYYPERGKINEKAIENLFSASSSEAEKWGDTWFFQANERPSWCTDAEYEQVAFDLVKRAHGRCRTFEVENEPNFRFTPQDYINKALIPFAHGAKRADPNCTILAPGCVSVPLTIKFVDAILEANAISAVDAISTHTYVGPGEPWELFGNPQYLDKLRTKIGAKMIWQTEQGYTWSHTSRQDQARNVVRQYLNGAAAGIPSSHQYYFYPVHRGFEPWYLVEMGSSDGLNGTYEPAGIALRVLSEQTGGLSLGHREEPLPGVYMLRYNGKERDVVALWTIDYSVMLKFRGAILGAVDIMGNSLPLARAAGITSMNADGYVRYLTLKHGDSLTVAGPSFGKDLCVPENGATAHASSETKDHPAAYAIDGKWSMRDAVAGLPQRTYWESAVSGPSEQKPDWIEIDFPSQHTIDRALLLTPLPAVDGGVPRDFSLQISDDGTRWTTLAVEQAWVGWAKLLTFRPVRASHIRLVISKLNDGWHLDGRWEYMIGDSFTRYTSMQCRVLDLMLFGP